jgi:hypothetical protein
MFGELIKACERCTVALLSPALFYYVFYNPCSCKEDADARGVGVNLFSGSSKQIFTDFFAMYGSRSTKNPVDRFIFLDWGI